MFNAVFLAGTVPSWRDEMTKKLLAVLFVAVAAIATPVLAADCCAPGAACCDLPCCSR
jgi:hypothetical protein